MKRIAALLLAALFALPSQAAIQYIVGEAGQVVMFGLSSDTKPAVNGYVFIETDTAKMFVRTAGTYVESTNVAYVAAASYTAADVLSKLLTVDGASSLLDADFLDGTSSASFALLAGPTFTGTVTLPSGSVGSTASANDSDTSLATTAFVQQEIDDGDNLSDNCAVENDSTPIPTTCLNTGLAPTASPTFTGTVTVPDASFANAKLANMNANTAKVNNTAGAAAPADLAMGASTVLARLAAGNIVAATPTEINTLIDNRRDLVFVATPANTAINDTNDVTIVSQNVTTAAGDVLIIDAEFTVLNNSTATRVMVFTLDCDALTDIEFSTGALATSATLMHPFHIHAVCDIRASNLMYEYAQIDGQLAAGIASGGDVTMAATNLEGASWGTSTSDATGTTTVALKARSANATATQTLRLHNLTIRRVTPG